MKFQKVLIMIIVTIFAMQGFAAEKSSENALTLGTTTVTAQKVERDKQKLAGSITAFDSESLDMLGKDNIQTVLEQTPNINFTKMDSHTMQYTFRGIGGTANMNKVFYLNMDGVAVPYVATDTLVDVERIEFLRGGQGALYGRNTHTGLINVITKSPEFTDVKSDFGISYEKFNKMRFNASVGGAATDKIAYRLAFGYQKTDGYMENTYLDEDDSNDSYQVTGRAKILYRSDAGDFTFGIYADKFDSAFDMNLPIGKKVGYKTENNESGENTGDIFSPTLKWEYTTGSGIDVTSITNYSRTTYGFTHDWDFSSMDMVTGHYDETFKVFSQELRFANSKSEKLQWLAGLFGRYEDLNTWSKMLNGTATGPYAGLYDMQDSDITTKNLALFGQAVYKVFPKLELTAALRLDYEKKELDWKNKSTTGTPMVNHTDEKDWVAFSPSLSASYSMTDANRVYAMVARGFKAGDFNNVMPVPLVATSKPVDPEYTITYEVGSKNSFYNNRLEVNAALFYIDWTDMQVDLRIPGSGFYEKLNAGEAHSSGFELETRFIPANGWMVIAGGGYMFDYEFDKFNNGAQSFVGNKLPYTNEYTFNLGVTYQSPMGFFLGADAAYKGDQYLLEDNSVKQDAYVMANAKVGYSADKWEVSLYARNLLDEKYATSSFNGSYLAGEPFTFGASAKLRF